MIGYLSISIPYPTLEFFQWVNSWFFGFFVAWVCIGSVCAFVMSVTEMFNDQSNYSNTDMFCGRYSLREEAMLLGVMVYFWPITAFIIYTNVQVIRAKLNENLVSDQNKTNPKRNIRWTN